MTGLAVDGVNRQSNVLQYQLTTLSRSKSRKVNGGKIVGNYKLRLFDRMVLQGLYYARAES